MFKKIAVFISVSGAISLFAAGSNKTFDSITFGRDGTTQTTVALSGSSLYNATATVGMPIGYTATTGTTTVSLIVTTNQAETLVNANNIFQVGTSTTIAVLKNGHVENHQPVAPVESSCGGAAPNVAAGSSDRMGAMQTGTAATGCTLTFGNTWTNAPFCIVADNSTTAVSSIGSISTTQLVVNISAALSGGFIYYFCEGNQ